MQLMPVIFQPQMTIEIPQKSRKQMLCRMLGSASGEGARHHHRSPRTPFQL